VRCVSGDAGCDDDCTGRKLVLTGAAWRLLLTQG
jgi:hypothetical protein